MTDAFTFVNMELFPFVLLNGIMKPREKIGLKRKERILAWRKCLFPQRTTVDFLESILGGEENLIFVNIYFTVIIWTTLKDTFTVISTTMSFGSDET